MDRDGDNLLKAIIAAPADDLPRLAYADWLEENGNVNHAIWIRNGLARPNEQHVVPTRDNLIFRAPAVDGFVLVAKGPPFDGSFTVRRGFVAAVQCAIASWVKHGPGLVAEHPLENVKITAKHPAAYACWIAKNEYEEEGFSHIHGDIFDMIEVECKYIDSDMQIAYKNFKNEAAALDALSDACLAWARAKNNH